MCPPVTLLTLLGRELLAGKKQTTYQIIINQLNIYIFVLHLSETGSQMS